MLNIVFWVIDIQSNVKRQQFFFGRYFIFSVDGNIIYRFFLVCIRDSKIWIFEVFISSENDIILFFDMFYCIFEFLIIQNICVCGWIKCYIYDMIRRIEFRRNRFYFIGYYENIFDYVYFVVFQYLMFVVEFVYFGIDFDQFWIRWSYFYFYVKNVIF